LAARSSRTTRTSSRSTWARARPSSPYEREAAAQDAGVSSERSGFRGVSFHHIVPSREAVDETMAIAIASGGRVVREAAEAPWGYFGYFSDPDGYLWKVATSS
jgi:predicted enzyme related to lactoylglutathione lyase